MTKYLGLKTLLLILFVFANLSFSINKDLQSFGIVPFKNKSKVPDLNIRLKTQGNPTFLVQDVRKGLQIGDLILFTNKAILITQRVWATLQKLGILSELDKTKVIQVSAKSETKNWRNRYHLSKNSMAKNTYKLGGEIVKIFEDYFNQVPEKQEFIVRFEGDQMTLIAPKSMLRNLKFNKVRKAVNSEKPLIVSEAPDSTGFFMHGQMQWTVWAIDPAESHSDLRYKLLGDLPEGLTWNNTLHRIEGIPTQLGTWPLQAVAYNSSNRTDTLSFDLKVIQNSPPRIQKAKAQEVPSGGDFNFSPLFSDRESSNGELTAEAIGMPPKMTFDVDKSEFKWKAPEVTKNLKVKFGLQVTDPGGLKTTQYYHIKVTTQKGLAQNQGVRLNLPADTLIQGLKYTWQDSDWLDEEMLVSEIKGEDFQYYAPSGGREGSLILAPKTPGELALEFLILVDTTIVPIPKKFIVLPNHPPVFKSTLPSREYKQGQSVYYKPVIEDIEQDSFELAVYDQYGKLLDSAEHAIKLKTDEPGDFYYQLLARDTTGKEAYQIISYKVKAHSEFWRGVRFDFQTLAFKETKRDILTTGDTLLQKNPTAFYSNLYVDFSTWRLGLFSPSLFRATERIPGLETNHIEWPFLFFGANILSDELIKQGNYLFLDGGLTFRQPTNEISTGGILFRLQGAQKNLLDKSWNTYYHISIYAKQSTIIFLKKDILTEGENVNCVDENNQDDFALIMEECSPTLYDVFSSYNKPDNLGFLMELESFYQFPYDLEAGIVYWNESKPTDHFFQNNVGVGIKHFWEHKRFQYSQTLKVGFNEFNFDDIQFTWFISLGYQTF